MFTGRVMHYSLITVHWESQDNHRTGRFTNVLRVETHLKPSVVTPVSRQLNVLLAALNSWLADDQDILNLILQQQETNICFTSLLCCLIAVLFKTLFNQKKRLKSLSSLWMPRTKKLLQHDVAQYPGAYKHSWRWSEEVTVGIWLHQAPKTELLKTVYIGHVVAVVPPSLWHCS